MTANIQQDAIELSQSEPYAKSMEKNEPAAKDFSKSIETDVSPETHSVGDDEDYPTGLKFWLIILDLGALLVLGGLDNNIVATTVPSITDHFHTVADIGWYNSAFRLCSCAFQFVFGRLYKVFSVKLTFMLANTILLVGSILCSTAVTSTMFIIGRAVSGIGFAGIIGGVLNIISHIMPLRKRPLYCGMLSGVESAAVIAAPIVGGALTQSLGWRWCFWINLPIGGVTLLMTIFLVSDPRPGDPSMTTKQRLAQLDPISNLLLIPALTSLFIALSWAGIEYSWTDGKVIGPIVTFVVLMALFVYYQHVRGEAAALPPRIIGKRSIIAGAVFAIGTNSSINILEYYLPTYYQTVREYSPGSSGYMIIPIIVGSPIGMFLCGFGTSTIGYYTPFMLLASITMPIFSGLVTTFDATTSFVRLILYSGAFGFASGIGFNAPISAVQVVLPIEDVSLGISIILFAQQIGPAITMAVAQVIFINRLSTNLIGTISTLDPATIQNSGLTEIINDVPAAQHMEVLEGISRSLDETWYLVVGLTCATLIGSLLMEWRSVKHKKS
ncbi:hypothetical protein PFICI_10484 [Pestalotiopsis fici W106-1]|uniref:Major facilitator superfamily (MFS) profile domain-containing protein n=1 Tax=Pestalotiopsis fici (strain W106-1 / CGMCC3.15140) TaxID=1229662 RepID=W3WZ71_PESFW|nr:uncharacterized protein PFICI_10484 [Pestalotiopsis fici W106-1]ETS78422.1 hypothetical protein PFICI_10484 [Pestalotiopsis fici W106-1]